MTDLEKIRKEKLEVLLKAVRAWHQAAAGRAAVEAEYQIELALRELVDHDKPDEAA